MSTRLGATDTGPALFRNSLLDWQARWKAGQATLPDGPGAATSPARPRRCRPGHSRRLGFPHGTSGGRSAE